VLALDDGEQQADGDPGRHALPNYFVERMLIQNFNPAVIRLPRRRLQSTALDDYPTATTAGDKSTPHGPRLRVQQFQHQVERSHRFISAVPNNLD
jgi:hypothetical protein